MDKFLVYFFGVLASLLAGGIISAILIFFWDTINKSFLRRKLKKTPKGDYIPPKKEIDERRPDEDERKRAREFREYERLRHVADKDRGNGKGKYNVSGTDEDARRRLLQANDELDSKGYARNIKKSIRENDEARKFTEPVDV